VLRGDLTDGEWVDLFVGFTNRADALTEFRVRWNGACDLEIDNVTVFEVDKVKSGRPGRVTWPETYTRPVAARQAAAEHLFRRALASRGWRYRVFRDAYLRRDSPFVVPAAEPGDIVAAWTAEFFAQRARDTEPSDRDAQRVGRAFEALAWHLSPAGMHLPDNQVGLRLIATGRRSISVRGEEAYTDHDERPADTRLWNSPLWRGVLSEIALYGWPGPWFDNRPPPPDGADPRPWPDDEADPFDVPIRVHALTHAARLGELRALPRLELFVADEKADPGLRGFALATLALLRPDERDALLRQYAPPSAPPELHAMCARWIGEYGVVAARPYLWSSIAGAAGRNVEYEARALGALAALLRERSSEIDRDALDTVAHPFAGKLKTDFGPNHPHGMAQGSLNTTSLTAGRPLIARVRLKFWGTGIDPQTLSGILVDPVSGEPFTRGAFAVERIDTESGEADLLAPFQRKRGQKAVLRVFRNAVWTGGARDHDGGRVSVLGIDILRVR